VEVAYGGVPRVAPRAPWDGGFTWARTADGAPWIATTCQGEGADLWWPCKDHPSDEARSMDLRITVPETVIPATNGRFVSMEDAGGGWRTHHWHVSTPINNYGVALNIAPYVRLDADYESVTGEEFPVSFWVLPENERQGREFLDEIVEHLRFHEEVCGPYPFRADKYGVVETPHLGMEHQSIIAYGNRYQGDATFDYDWLHHHELSHEWWANLVTARDWNDFWIHEGIGTYMQALYLERKFGAEAYAQKMAQDRGAIRNAGPLAPRGSRTTRWMYFGGRAGGSPGGDIYSKGSWVCHNLRWLLGDDKFFEVLRRWAYPDPALEAVTDGSHCRLATTDELLAIAERVSGRELDWFFEVLLRRAALPVLESRVEDGELRLRWNAPDGLPYPMPVEVRKGGKLVRVELADGAAQVDVGRAEVEVDPRAWLLCERAQ
ncbi:MAG TPA: M1 family metallopeptidase, partial [Planctomycetota bacterium]|nr:M1 family metallopeptidase [Planctomycetota bacterium]